MRLMLSLLSLLFALPGAAEPPVPLLWRVSAGDSELYLLGSVHMLKASDYPLDDAVMQAYANADQLILELSPDDLRAGGGAGQMFRLGALPAGESLRDHVSEQTWQAVQAYVDGGGYLPLTAVERMRPWFFAVTLAAMEMQRAGLNPALGIEQFFLRLQAADGKPGSGLETIAQQLAVFTDGSREEQDMQLRQTLEKLSDAPEQLDRMHALWRAGDDVGLHAFIHESMADYPALYQRLITARHSAWIPQLEAELADPEVELVIVGAAHLGGDDGLVTLLRQRGHAVTRVGATTAAAE
jgi:uncharacterized protein